MSGYTATWDRRRPDRVTVTGAARPLAYPICRPRSDGSVDRHCERYDGAEGPFLYMLAQTPFAIFPGSHWQRGEHGDGTWSAPVFPVSRDFAEGLEWQAAPTQ